MKKVLIGSLLTVGAAVLFSCNNGAYDANPKTDYSGAVNPLDTANNKGVVLIGSMKGSFAGATLVFSPAYYTINSENEPAIRNVYASIRNDSVFHRVFQLACENQVVKSDDTLSKQNIKVTYSVYDSVMKKNKVYTMTKPEDFRLFILSAENNGMRGGMFGKLYNVLPEPGNPNDFVEFKNVSFYFEKR